MPAGTNTTSCTSSRGRSEFLAKITAGRAEAGGTETKQSQEQGVSGPVGAICREASDGRAPLRPPRRDLTARVCALALHRLREPALLRMPRQPPPSSLPCPRRQYGDPHPSRLRDPQLGPGRHLLRLRSVCPTGQRPPGDQEAPLAPGAEPGQSTYSSAVSHQGAPAPLLGAQRLSGS